MVSAASLHLHRLMEKKKEALLLQIEQVTVVTVRLSRERMYLLRTPPAQSGFVTVVHAPYFE